MTPDVGELCAAGEAAFENDEFEEAEAWYELACRGGYKTVYVRGNTREVVDHPKEALIRNRFARWEQLRTMMYERSVRRLAKPDPGHGLAMMTCMGRNEGCMPTALAIAANRWHVYGPVYMHIDGLDGRAIGQAQSFFNVLLWAAQEKLTTLTLLEDDVVLAKNALDYIATTEIDDDLAFISWFSIDKYLGPRLPPLLNCIEARDYQYNQAITFPARTVHELLVSDALKNWSEPHGADCLYAKVFPERKVAVHYPNLVQHVGGRNSLVGNNRQGARESPTFIGESVDALGLIR